MKKYPLFLLVLSFSLGLFSISINSISAYAPGCSGTSGFSSTTGESCNMPQSNFSFYRNLSIGSKGDDVLELQQILKDQGYSFGVIDGSYGKRTARAVRDFQYDNDLAVTGNADAETLSKIGVFQSSQIYPPGCSSNQGYSISTGQSCNVQVTPQPVYPPGCTSTQGFSSITGEACDGSQRLNASLLPGCSSKSGFSVTTGQACDGTTYTSIPSVVPGCSSAAGWSSTTGQACDGSVYIPTPTPQPTPTNHNPQFGSITATNVGVVGQVSQFSFNATDPDNDDLTWSVNWRGGSYGSNCVYDMPHKQNGANQNYSDRTTWDAPGNYNVMISVSDCKGGTAQTSFIIKINPTATTTPTYLAGCSSNSGYSVTTGQSCDGTLPPQPTPNPTPPACVPTSSATPVATTNSIGTITITSPNGGECLTKGSTKTITWTNSPNINQITIDLVSSSGTMSWIANNIANTGSYDWNVSVGNTTNTKFKIEIIGYQTGTGSVVELSDDYFSVQ